MEITKYYVIHHTRLLYRFSRGIEHSDKNLKIAEKSMLQYRQPILSMEMLVYKGEES